VIGDPENRLRERRIMFFIWTGAVAVVVWLGGGFGGGFEAAYRDNPLGWALTASPVIPLVPWLKARRDTR
jgi:hypothetical protein